MSLKGREKFVADSLVTHYREEGKPVDYREGEDPPDIYLDIDGSIIAVEITEIDTNVINNRKTLDRGYLQFIDSLNKSHIDILPEGIGLLIHFYHNNTKVGKVKKEFMKILSSFMDSDSIVISNKIESSIGRVSFTLEFLKTKNAKSGFAGSVGQYGGKSKKSRDINEVSKQIAESNLSLMSTATVQDRIIDKNEKCKYLQSPVHLALYDNYYNKFTEFTDTRHFDFYNEVMSTIPSFGLFEKVMIIFENGDVLEYANQKMNKIDDCSEVLSVERSK